MGEKFKLPRWRALLYAILVFIVLWILFIPMEIFFIVFLAMFILMNIIMFIPIILGYGEVTSLHEKMNIFDGMLTLVFPFYTFTLVAVSVNEARSSGLPMGPSLKDVVELELKKRFSK